MTSTPHDPQAPLAGIRVLEVSVTPAGAYAGLLCEQLGATVTRLETPLLADCGPDVSPALDRSLNAGKASCATDDILASLSADRRFDLLVTDAEQNTACDASVRDIASRTAHWFREHAVAVSLDTGGANGTGLTASARAGMSWAIGNPGMAPLALPLDLPYYHAGTEGAAMGILGLLLAARADVRGQQWNTRPSDVLTYYAGQIASNFLPYERPWARDGARASMSGGSYPAAMFECKDGWISVMCRTDSDWVALLAAMGEPEWSREERFRDPRQVARFHADEADAHVRPWFAAMTRDEAFALGDEYKFPMAPVLSVAESLELGQFGVREFFLADDDGLRRPGAPWQIRTPGKDEARTERRPALESWQPTPAAPLAGLRVLDLSWAWSGPMLTSGLRDLGAEVIKIESRRRPDPTRVRGAAIRNGEHVPGPPLEATPYFNQVNHGKKSVVVDFTTTEGAGLIVDLAAQVDVVVENLRPGVLTRRGLGYDTLSERNPSLVMMSMSLMGQHGPMSTVGGYAPVMSGLSGLDSLVGYSTDDLVGLFNPALGDPNGADHALVSLLAALLRLERTGSGGHIDLSQTEALVAIERASVAEAQLLGRGDVPGNGHHTFWPHGTYRCSGEDRWVAVAARNNSERRALAAFLGLPGSPDLALFDQALQATFAEARAERIEAELTARGVPVAVVRTFEEVQADPQSAREQRVNRIPHKYLGEQQILNIPWEASGTRFPATEPGPLLGEHTADVLDRLLGIRGDSLRSLVEASVVATADVVSLPG